MSNSVLFNPEFDHRALYPQAIPEYDPKTKTFPMKSNVLLRGQMWHDAAVLKNYTNVKAKDDKDSTIGGLTLGVNLPPGYKSMGFRFLYNPSSLEVGYSTDNSLYPPGVVPDSQDPSRSKANDSITLIGPGSAQLAFSLILDRTYDCWAGPPDASSTDDPQRGNDRDTRLGINVDIKHFQAMVGYSEATPFVASPPMFLALTGNAQGTFHYGYITSFSTGISNWTRDGIPNRGGIGGINFQILPLTSRARTLVATGGPGALRGAGLPAQPFIPYTYSDDPANPGKNSGID